MMDKGKSYVEDATVLVELRHELWEHKRCLVGTIKRDVRPMNVMSIDRAQNTNETAMVSLRWGKAIQEQTRPIGWKA